jgi:hypothetical protein
LNAATRRFWLDTFSVHLPEVDCLYAAALALV